MSNFNIEGKIVLVWLELREGAQEITDGCGSVGDIVQCLSLQTDEGFKAIDVTSWPFEQEKEYYKLIAVQPLDEIKMPTHFLRLVK
jgi:hypothetical protein